MSKTPSRCAFSIMVVADDCLSRACRALVDENGPYGVPGKTAYSSGDTGDRVDKFCAKASGVKEAQFFTEIDDPTDDNREAMDVFVKMMNDDEKERSYLFNSEFTHVGISCGCDAIHEERCCFAFGKDV